MLGRTRRLWTGLLIVTLCLGATLGCKRAKPPRSVAWPTTAPAAEATGIAEALPVPSDASEATPTASDLIETLFPAATRIVSEAETATPAPPLAEPLPTGVASPAPAIEGEYVVAPGDTLSSIARAHNTTVAAIMSRNGLANPDVVRVGQRLVIPRGGGGGGTPAPSRVYHTVGRGDTLWKLARRYSTHPQQIVEQNKHLITNPDQLTPGVTLTITVGTGPVVITHAVRRGETLSSIARRYGVSAQDLVRANGLASPNRVYVGQILVIPK